MKLLTTDLLMFVRKYSLICAGESGIHAFEGGWMDCARVESAIIGVNCDIFSPPSASTQLNGLNGMRRLSIARLDG